MVVVDGVVRDVPVPTGEASDLVFRYRIIIITIASHATVMEPTSLAKKATNFGDFP